MRTFDYRRVPDELYCAETMELVASVHEEKGRAECYLAKETPVLALLRERARLQSATFSNRIEKIYASEERITAIARGGVELKTQGESEIAGYLDLFDTIRDNYQRIPVAPSYILELHRALYQYTDATFAGQWKENDILVLDESEDPSKMSEEDWKRQVQRQRRIFEPVFAFETPLAVGALCDTYTEAIEEHVCDPLVLIALFSLDFACIRPFTNGNGRMSRLMSLLMLDRCGFTVGDYVSLSTCVEEHRDEYLRVSQESAQHWRTGENHPKAYVVFFLERLLEAYGKLEASAVKAHEVGSLSKTERIRALFEHSLGQLSKREIAQECPDISIATIEAALGDMVKDGSIEKLGTGKSTRYARKR